MRDRRIDKFACNAVSFTILIDTPPRMIIKKKKKIVYKNDYEWQIIAYIFTIDIVPLLTVI